MIGVPRGGPPSGFPPSVVGVAGLAEHAASAASSGVASFSFMEILGGPAGGTVIMPRPDPRPRYGGSHFSVSSMLQRQMCDKVVFSTAHAHPVLLSDLALRCRPAETSPHAASPEGEPHLPPRFHSAPDLLRRRRGVDRCR